MVKKINKKLKLTTPDLVVLSLLSETPMHGYDLNQELNRRDVQDWADVSRPQVYYSLKKLEILRMISEIQDSFQSAGPDRQIYQITNKGKNELSNSLDNNNWAHHRPISSFLTWMALSAHATKESIVNILDARKTFLERELYRERMTLKSFKDVKGKMVIPGLLMVELTIKQFEIELRWLKKVKNKLL